MGVVLVGYRGSGKTTVGRLVAEQMRMPLIDTDFLIVESADIAIRDIFASQGEASFRELETAALRKALTSGECVIATGGGIVVRPENRKLIATSGAFVVYLRADAQALHARITGDAGSNANRPNLTALGGGLAEVRHLLEIRDPLYREVASLIVDVTGKSPEAIAQEIVRGCERAPHPR